MNQKEGFDVVVGATSGVIKGVKIGRTNKDNKIKNLQTLALITENDHVTRIEWGNDDEREILVACGVKRDRRIKIYDAESAVLTNSFLCNIGTGSINGLSRYNRSILTAVKSGDVCLWPSSGGKGEILLNAGENLGRMCHSCEQKNIIATGGTENRLKLWDLETQKMTFVEKSLPHDWLNLRIPVWISDINFLSGSQQIVTVGRHGHIYLYDPLSQRRPVINMTIQNESWTSLAIPSREKQIIVGSGKGKLNLVDLRKPGTLLNTYKGFTGGVTRVACSRIKPYVASVSLDRYLRIHNIDTKKVLKCIYLTSKLSCLVMRSDIEIENDDGTET
ncbi:WD repeat-containing protein 74 [Monomorium pharaonis]|uniref:WD repeat-containing protein 74 n=1 Tax=Monomorium pharaonis TaxID=307658 RepID=UPI0017460E83|nr:WD repeat-containing protein 74 [Monomorium pharaonis]